MKRSALVVASCLAILGCLTSINGFSAWAQAAASPGSSAAAAQPGAAPADPFPVADRKFFTAVSPTETEVESFLHALWGYDQNRIWRIEGIEKTPAPGVSKVVVYVSEKKPNAKVQTTAFYVTPDGKHAIADAVIDFGAHPFAEKRKLLVDRASGPAVGAASKDLMLVEFSDLQCPHCKDAQVTMKQLATDFPQARIVYQVFPLTSIHPAAFQAASQALCIAKQSSEAFLKYEDAVYATQEALTPEGMSKTLVDAVTKSGQDPAAIVACAATPATQDAVRASMKLGEDAGVDQTPTLMVNGRSLPVSPAAMPYETLKKIILFQAELDGVKVDPPPPSLTSLGK